MTIPKTGAITMEMTSGLTGAGLSVPPLSWRKGRDVKGALTLTATLGPRPVIDRFQLTAPGLKAEGRLTTRDSGALEEVLLTRLQTGEWLDATARIIGRGAGRPVGVAVLDGSLDLRKMPSGDGGSSGGGNEIEVALDQLVVSSGITLTGFRGAFLSRAGGWTEPSPARSTGRAGSMARWCPTGAARPCASPRPMRARSWRRRASSTRDAAASWT